MASNFPNNLTPEELATMAQGVKTGTVQQDAYLSALKKLTMAGAVSAEAAEAVAPDGVPSFVKSATIHGSGNAALDGTYLEAQGVKAWVELKHALLKAKLMESAVKMKSLTDALNQATEQVKNLTAICKSQGHWGHVIVTDLASVFSTPGDQTFKVPSIVYVSATPGGKCFEAEVHSVQSTQIDFEHKLSVKLALQAKQPLSGWGAPYHNPVKYAEKPPKVDWQGLEPVWPAPFDAPADPGLPPYAPKKPKITLNPKLVLKPEKWVPPTVKTKGGGGLSPAAQAKNELAAKKKKSAPQSDPNLDELEAKWKQKQVELMLLHQAKLAEMHNAEIKKGQASTMLKLSEIDKLLEKLQISGVINQIPESEPEPTPVTERWIPEGYVAVQVVGKKEKQLIKK